MNTRQWGGMLFLVMALLLMGYGQTQKNAALRIRSQGEQVWGGDINQCVGSRYDCPDPMFSTCVPGTGACYWCEPKGIWTGCVAVKDDKKSCSPASLPNSPWCGKLLSGVLNGDGKCNKCTTPTTFNCGVQSGATGSGCSIGTGG